MKEQPQGRACSIRLLPIALPTPVASDFAALSLFVEIQGGVDASGRGDRRLAHFVIVYSLGGYESLVFPPTERLRTATSWQGEGPLVRLHIGLEDVDDLIEDLAAGLAGYGAA